MITQERLKELFDYQDGNLLWKVQKANRIKIGSIAGSMNSDKYGQHYMNVSIDDEPYKLHRLIYLWHHGTLPKIIDHIDGNRLNNAIENLRGATASQNALNGKFRVNNNSGYKNVSFEKRKQKWRVCLSVNGVSKSFGYYDDLELAALVAEEARNKFCKQFARHF